MHSPERLTLPLVVQSAGGAHDDGILVTGAPVPRRDEGAGPHPGLGLARRLFVRLVIPGDAHKGQRPSVAHYPFLDVLAIDLAPRHRPAAAVGQARMAAPDLVVGMFYQFVARGDPAGPALALAVEAELIHRRCVDAA